MRNDKIIQFGIIGLVVVVLIFVFVDTLSHLSENEKKLNSDAGSQAESALASWWLSKAYFAEPKAPDVVMLGSSQLAPLMGADAYVYDRAIDITDDHRSYLLEEDFQTLLNKNWRVFIGALPGAMISDQLAIVHALFSKEYKPKIVAIAISPADFIDKRFPSVTDTEAYTFFSKYTGPDLLRKDLDKIRTEKYVSKYVDADKGSSEEESPLHLGKPFQRISPTDIIIYSNEGDTFKNDAEEYKLRYQNPLSPQFDTQMNYFASLLKYLAQQHIPVVVFNFPITAANKKLLPDDFWKNYNNRINEICKSNGADFISADKVLTPFEDNEFIDGTHLNLIGGLRWSRPVAVYTANKLHQKTFPELVACVKHFK